MKRYLIYLFVGFSLHLQVAAQANLVPNPSFEDTIHGPIYGSINGILGTCVKDWYSPNTNPGDGAWYYYFGPNLPMPTALEYIYLPNSGIGMIKIGIVESFNPIRREYTQCQLIDSMRYNETYYVSYFVKRYNLPSSACQMERPCFSVIQLLFELTQILLKIFKIMDKDFLT